MVNYAEIIN
jgi:hypothetical protein